MLSFHGRPMSRMATGIVCITLYQRCLFKERDPRKNLSTKIQTTERLILAQSQFPLHGDFDSDTIVRCVSGFP